ncbi:trichohyalin isoform X4 [Simochromis diagramma]|uniref:trichohyalin isoform X4 n=1 Tax=Simochromis diagramma TaxID=43689 RepID=UPI001A7E405B|nr:trichohyalin isoform X4 [Simochromis diagramma]
MDPESPVSRMERTLWTVWYYITGAVNRFIRPQPADTVNNDPNTNQESAAEIKHPPSDSTEGDSSREGVEEEQLVATSSLLSSSRPVVEWELCTTEIDLGVDEENMQYKTQLRKVDESKEDGEGKREEQRDKTGNDHSNDSRAKEDERQTMEIEKMPTCAGLAGPGNDEHEHAASGPQNWSEVATCQDTTEEETDAENATVRLGLPGDHPTKEEKIKETQVKGEKDQTHDKEKEDLEAEDTLRKEEDDDKLRSEDERELKAENIEVKACIAAGISPDDMDHMEKGKGEVKEHDAVLLDDHSGREELVKETRLKEENAKADHEKEQDSEAEATEVTEEYNNMHCDDDNLVAENNAFKVCMTKSPKEEDYVHKGEGEVQKIDAVTQDHHPREDQIIKDTQINEEDDTLHHEEERDLEADPEINVCSIKDISPEDQAHTYEGEAEVQKNDAVTLDDHPKEDKITEETQLEEEDDKMQHEDEQDLEAEDIEIKVCITTDISPVLDDCKQETEADLQKTDKATLDDHPREDETKDTQLEEEDDKLQHKDDRDLEAEDTEVPEEDEKTDYEDEQQLGAEGTEVQLFKTTDISPVLDDHKQETEAELQKTDTATLDEHPREDESKETQLEDDHPIEDEMFKEDNLKEEDEKTDHADEQDFEAEDTEIKACISTSLSLNDYDNDHLQEIESEVQQNDAVTLDEHPREDETKETQLEEEDDKLQHKDEQDLEAEDTEVPEEDDKTDYEDEQQLGAEGTEVQLFKTTDISPVLDDHKQETEAELQKTDTATLDEHPREDEMFKEDNLKEEDEKTDHADERDFEAEDTEIKACISTSLSLNDYDNDHLQEIESEVQQNDAVTLDEHPREDETKETQLEEEDDKLQHKDEQDLEAEDTEVPEEDDKTDYEDEQQLGAEGTEVQLFKTTDISPVLDDHKQETEAELQKTDTATLDEHPREDESKETQLEDDHPIEDEMFKEDNLKEEDEKTDHADEQDFEAEDTEIKACISTSLSPDDDDNRRMQEIEPEEQQNDAVTLDEHPREDEITKETQLEEEDDKMQHKDDQGLESEDTEVPEEDDKTDYEDEQQLGTEGTEVELCKTTDISPVLDDHKQETEAELQKTDTATLDEHPREDESKETQLEDDHPIEDEMFEEDNLKEEDEKTDHADERDFEAEDTEIKVCISTSLSPDDDDNHRMQEIESEVQQNDAVTLDEHPREDEITKETQLEEEDDKMQHEDEQDLESEACDVMLQLDSQNVIKSEEKTSQAENQLSAFGDQPDTSVDMLTVITKSYAMTHSSENDKGEKEKWVETERPAVNETTEVPDLDENIGTEAEDTEGENLLTEYDLSGKEAALKTASQLHTAGFTDKYEEDMRVPGVQTKTRQTGVTVTDISEERLIDQDQEKEENVSSESYTGEFYNEIIDSSTSVTVKPKGETTQETDEEFKNTLPEISEGQCAVLQELNTPTCEEIQEGVSKYNNELQGADENTTQRFLEAGDCEEIPATQLPEEVESGDQESLENSDCRTGADYLLMKESMEEKQESKEETETSFGLFVEEHEGTPDLELEAERKLVEGVIQESGLDKEEGKLLTSSMKTEVTGTHVGLVDETERRSEGLHDGGRGSTGGETREAVAAAEVVGFVIQESVAAIKLDQSISRPLSLQEDTSEYGFVRPLAETEPISVDDTSVEMQDKAIEKEGRGCEDEEEEAENGIQTLNEMDLQITKETAGELITERGDKEIPLNAELEISQHTETQEINNQSPHRALEISETQIIVAETADEPRPEDLPVMSSEEKGGSVSGHQDVIDEEILDLWIEAVMSEDTDEIRQEEPKPGQLLDTKTDTLNEGEISTENEKVSLAEAICRESEAVSDTEMSSSTVESGFLDQFLSESCIQSSETQLLKSTSTDSLQGIHELVASVSTDIFGVIAQPQTQDLLTEESAETEKESVADIEAQSHLNQESQEKAEERAETLETESGSQNAYEDVEEADVTTMTTQSSPLHDKKVEAEEEHLEVTASDSSDELKPAESEESESDSQSEPEKDTLNLSSLNRPQPAHSSLFPVLNEAQVAEEPTIEYENKVDGPVLDFAVQRSRIAVKNPRVRPPKNPRSLLHMPSEEPTPTPTPSSRLPVKLPGGVPLGGIGIGIKLPGLGAGFPVLKKTQRAVRDENTQETVSQEPETKPEEKNDAPPQEEEEAPKKPKWMPPKHPGGFGNPLMAELKTKLKKTPKE